MNDTDFTKEESEFLLKNIFSQIFTPISDNLSTSFLEESKKLNFSFLTVKEKEDLLSNKEALEQCLIDTIDNFFQDYIDDIEFTKSNILKYEDDLFYLLKVGIFVKENDKILSFNIYFILEHINDTLQTLNKYPKYNSDNFGTAFYNNDYKTVLNPKRKEVKRGLGLDGGKFPIVSKDDNERLHTLNTFLRTFSNHTPSANSILILLSQFGIEHFNIGFTIGQEAGIKQAMTELNGLKTSKEELVRSFMIKLSLPYKNKTINKTRLCNFIKDVSADFFSSIVYDNKNRRYKVSIEPRYLKYNTYIKTTLMGNTIYAYDKKNEKYFFTQAPLPNAIEHFKKVFIGLSSDTYTEEELENTINNPLFDSVIAKILKNPTLPL